MYFLVLRGIDHLGLLGRVWFLSGPLQAVHVIVRSLPWASAAHLVGVGVLVLL